MNKEQEDETHEDNFDELDFGLGLDDGYDLSFEDSKAKNRQHKAKSRKNARRRVEDYMERKAFKKRMNEWDIRFDG